MRPSGRAYSSGVRDLPGFTHLIFLLVNVVHIRSYDIVTQYSKRLRAGKPKNRGWIPGVRQGFLVSSASTFKVHLARYLTDTEVFLPVGEATGV